MLTKTGQTITKTIGRLSGQATDASLYAAKGGQTIVGEGMKRVSAAAAKNPGSTILNNMPKFSGHHIK